MCIYVAHASRALQSHGISGEELTMDHILFWTNKGIKDLPGRGISSMSGPLPRRHEHERRYTPFTNPFIRAWWIWKGDYDDQIIFGDVEGLKFPDICLIGEEKPRKNLTQETCPGRSSNPGPLRDRRACYRLLLDFSLYSLFYVVEYTIEKW